ncbi:unnamed protein product [Somion occarium]|uniref:Transmembrane protein n=1 Tax=Somion occarium TaxID=3059160 RepID=A0ABP1E829_9APHY
MPSILRRLTDWPSSSSSDVHVASCSISAGSVLLTDSAASADIDGTFTAEPLPLEVSPSSQVSSASAGPCVDLAGCDNVGMTDAKKDAILNQIHQLTSDTQSIDASFAKVSQLLVTLLDSSLPTELRDGVQDLSCRWNRHRQAYRALMWQSRDVAADARVSADDFAKVFISNVLLQPNISINEMQEAIRHYRTISEQDKQKARDLVDGFNELGRDVIAFSDNWERVVLKNRLHRFSLRSKEYEERLSDLRSTLHRVKVKVVSMSVVLGLLVTAASAGALAVIYAMHGNPGISVFGMAALPIRFTMKNLRQALSERKALREQIRQLEMERDESENGMKDITNIASKLGAIASIWGCVHLL